MQCHVPSRVGGQRWIFDFPIEILDPRHARPTEILLLALLNDRLYYLTDLRRWTEVVRGRRGERWNERQKRRALEREIPGVAVVVAGNENGGTEWGEHGGAEVSGKLNLAQDVTAPGNTGASVRWKSRHDCGPQYILLTLRESRGIRQRRISRVPPSSPHRRQDSRRRGLDYFGFSSSRTMRRSRMLAHQRQGWFQQCSMETILVRKNIEGTAIALKRLSINCITYFLQAVILNKYYWITEFVKSTKVTYFIFWLCKLQWWF